MRKEVYGFTAEEYKEIPGLLQCYQDERNAMIAAKISEEIYNRLSLRFCENGEVAQIRESMASYAEKLGCHFLLFVWKEQEEERLCFYSDTKQVRALEFLDYLISEFGLVKGTAAVADGRISSAILKVQMAALDIERTFEYFLYMVSSYFADCDRIDAAEYGASHAQEIGQMKQYVKRKIPWAYVRSTDIVNSGEKFLIKSLENESGITLMASPKVYVMIGCHGESYDITQEKFEKTYETTDEKLNVFEQMIEFLPEAERVPAGGYITLDELAYLCYPKKGVAIYATMIERRTKIFPVNGGDEYYLGRPGDYMVVRSDDFSDIYIVKGKIFEETYAELDTDGGEC